MTEADPPLAVALPARLDARVRLGPFPSASEALRFFLYASLSLLVAGLWNPFGGLPLLFGGFALSVYQPNGIGLDRWAWAFLRWRFRVAAPILPARGTRWTVTGAVARGPTGLSIAVVEAEGRPVAFLPPARARELFAGFAGLLRSLDGGVLFVVGGRRIASRPFLPTAAPAKEKEREAREGYSELVRLLVRHRRRRTVHVVLWGSAAIGDPSSLDRRATALALGLDGIGVKSTRLRGRELWETLREIGYAPEGEG